MTRPGLSGVLENVMVMSKNRVGFSNVTGNMVLTGRGAAGSLQGTLEVLWNGTHHHKQDDVEILKVSVVSPPHNNFF